MPVTTLRHAAESSALWHKKACEVNYLYFCEQKMMKRVICNLKLSQWLNSTKYFWTCCHVSSLMRWTETVWNVGVITIQTPDMAVSLRIFYWTLVIAYLKKHLRLYSIVTMFLVHLWNHNRCASRTLHLAGRLTLRLHKLLYKSCLAYDCNITQFATAFMYIQI
jgi:hypothetical protein